MGKNAELLEVEDSQFSAALHSSHQWICVNQVLSPAISPGGANPDRKGD